MSFLLIADATKCFPHYGNITISWRIIWHSFVRLYPLLHLHRACHSDANCLPFPRYYLQICHFHFLLTCSRSQQNPYRIFKTVSFMFFKVFLVLLFVNFQKIVSLTNVPISRLQKIPSRPPLQSCLLSYSLEHVNHSWCHFGIQ